MKLRVRYFASLVDRTGIASEEVALGPGASVAELWEMLHRRHPRLAGLGYRPAVACDMAYADWDARLDGVEEVAFLPPVSGG